MNATSQTTAIIKTAMTARFTRPRGGAMAAYRKAIRYNAKMERVASANIRTRPAHARIMAEPDSGGPRFLGTSFAQRI